MPGPSRRSVLTGTAALALSGALPRFATAQAPGSTPPAPATAQVTRLKAGLSDQFQLGGQAPIALFQNIVPGPVLRVKHGDKLAVTVENSLETPFSVNWQGVRVPNALDGVPGLTGEAIAKGASADIAFAPPDAGTYLYRAFQPELAQRALAGAFIVEEPGTSPFTSDHVLLIQSWADPVTKLPLLTVNGVFAPTFEAPAGGRSRLRLINAGVHFLRLQVSATCYVMAIDGQPVQPFALKDGTAQLTPGGRLDLAVDIGTADPILVTAQTSQQPIQLALVTPVGPGNAPGTPAQPAPAALPSNGLPDKIPLEKAARFDVPLGPETVSLSGFESVGSVARGTSVVLALTNRGEAPVAVQLHGVPARLLDGADDGWKPWWHDAIPVGPKATVRVALLADAPGKWAIVGLRGGDGAVVAARSYEVK